MRRLIRQWVVLCVWIVAGWPATAVPAAELAYVGTHYDVSGTYFPTYSYPQNSIVEWRSDNSNNAFSARHTATGRYYGVDGWALFGTKFDFPDANATGDVFYRLADDPELPNLEELPSFVAGAEILAHHKAGGGSAALIDDPRTQWGGRWWTFDGTNYPPPDGTNTTGVVPYLKVGFLHGWDEYGHDPQTGPAARWGFTLGEHVPKHFRVGVMTDGLADHSYAPGEIFLAHVTRQFPDTTTEGTLGTILATETTGAIPLDTIGGEITPGTNRFIDMHFFDIHNAQPGDSFVIAAQTYPDQVYAGISGISFDVMKDPGDYNADGVVDAADYTTWRDTLGQGVKAGSLADGDVNSEIGAGDYDVWKNNFGHVTPGSGSGASGLSVPEPASAVLIFAVATFGFVACRRRSA